MVYENRQAYTIFGYSLPFSLACNKIFRENIDRKKRRCCVFGNIRLGGRPATDIDSANHSDHTNNAMSANFVVYISSFYHLWR